MAAAVTTEAFTSMTAAGLPIPAQLVRAITFLRGDKDGLAWLNALDRVLWDYAARWELQLESIAEGGAMSCCAFCVDDDGTDLVLKIPVEPRSGVEEAATLRSWAAVDVAPKVVKGDQTTGVFLMARVLPGTTFEGINDLGDLPPSLDMFERLRRAGRGREHEDIPELSSQISERLKWARERFNEPGVVNLRPNFEFVAEVARKLTDAENTGIVHGDLQAKNVLRGSNGRIFCIDPLTARGDRASDVAMWAVLQDTSIPIADLVRALAGPTSLDLQRLEDWAYVVATVELRPAQAARYVRQRHFLDEYERAHGE